VSSRYLDTCWRPRSATQAEGLVLVLMHLLQVWSHLALAGNGLTQCALIYPQIAHGYRQMSSLVRAESSLRYGAVAGNGSRL
jgi:hypothetical protein